MFGVKKTIVNSSVMLVVAAVAGLCVLFVATAERPPTGKTAISFQTPFSRGSYEFKQLEEMTQSFEADNPGIAVRLLADGPDDHERIFRHILARGSPDVLEMPLSELAELAGRSALLPLGEMAGSGELFPEAASAAQHNMVTYAQPFRARAVQLVCNASLLKEAGYDPANPPLNSWNQLRIVCDGIRRELGGRGSFALGIDAGEGDSLARLAAMLVCQNLGELVSEQTAPDSGRKQWRVALRNKAESDGKEAGVQALEMLGQLASYMPPDAAHWRREELLRAFLDGRIVMFFGDVRAVSELRSRAPNLPLKVVEAPAHRAPAACVDFFGAVITAAAAQRPGSYEACQKLLAHLGGSASQARVMTGGRTAFPVMVPVVRDLLDDPWYAAHPEYKTFANALWYPCSSTPITAWREVQRQAFLPALRRLVAADASHDQAAQLIVDRGNSVLTTHYGYVGSITKTHRWGMTAAAVGIFFLVFFTVGHRPKH